MENELNKLIGTPVQIELVSPVVQYESKTLSKAIIKQTWPDCVVVEIENANIRILIPYTNIVGVLIP